MHFFLYQTESNATLLTTEIFLSSKDFFLLTINLFWSFQFVYPAYATMLGNLRSKALENFKTRLEHSLSKGEGFAASVRTCAQSCMLDFDQGCAGNVS